MLDRGIFGGQCHLVNINGPGNALNWHLLYGVVMYRQSSAPTPIPPESSRLRQRPPLRDGFLLYLNPTPAETTINDLCDN